VNLPWSNTAAASNMPQKIWKELITVDGEKNPWKLVLMNCGKENVRNGNFLGFYNKLTGVLRVFVYVPESANAQGSTHMWGLLLNDKMASRSIFRYGVPNDRSITNSAAKAALKQTEEMAQIISPWKRGNFNGFNGTPLNPGWWAFDMDFSVYRDLNKENTFTSLRDYDDVMSVRVLSKKDQSLSMESKLLAQITGDTKLEATQASTSSGIFAPLEDLLGKANEVASLVDIAKSVLDPNPLNAIDNGIKLAKGACNLAGIDYGEKTEGFNGYKGTMNLAMDGTIDTKGVITNEENVLGVSPISFKKGDFLTKNCPTFGQGVWNLKKTPVVYYTNAYMEWRYEHMASKYFDKEETCQWLDRKGPFGGRADNKKMSKDPYRGYVCYFDPNSIQLVLNDELFSPTEIANARVYATCGVRKDMKFNSTDAYREAMKLGSRKFSTKSTIDYINRPFYEAPFDAMSSSPNKDEMKMKTGTTFATEEIEGKNYGVFGRGDEKFILEAQPLHGLDGENYMPAYEVNVTVIVTMDDNKEIVYNRTYLPEYEEMDIQNMPTEYVMPENYLESVYDQQINHIKDIYNWTRRTLHPTAGTFLHFTIHNGQGELQWGTAWTHQNESYPTLFDNDLSNRWVSSWDNILMAKRQFGGQYLGKNKSVIKNNPWSGKPCFFAEFETKFPSNPTSYTLISANDAGKYGGCNPNVWALYGKKNQNDEWTLLGMSSYDNQPEDMLPRENSKPTRALPFRFHDAKDMKYYRFEVLYGNDENLIRLGEIRFNYDN
jgi:hypothetical protein